MNAVIPARLYQRGHFLTWPYQKKHSMLNALGISMVVNLWRPIDSDLASDRGTRMYINWHMAGDAVPANSTTMIIWLGAMLRQGEVALVHCEAGMNRSAWLCARLLMEVMHVTPDVALRLIQERIPRAEINPKLLDDIKGAVHE